MAVACGVGVVLVPLPALDRRVVRCHEVLEAGHDGCQDAVPELDLRDGDGRGSAV